MSRSTMRGWLRQLMDEGWITREAQIASGLPPGAVARREPGYDLASLDEQTRGARFCSLLRICRPISGVWPTTRSPSCSTTRSITAGGSRVSISMRQNRTHLHLLIRDDGCGVFARIQEAFAIDTPQQALLELSKGKLTSQPEFHTGRGCFSPHACLTCLTM